MFMIKHPLDLSFVYFNNMYQGVRVMEAIGFSKVINDGVEFLIMPIERSNKHNLQQVMNASRHIVPL